MPNNLPDSIYSGGAVTFDSKPYTQFYLQTKARNQAKREAIDNYYLEMGKGLTPTGMAENDINGFVNRKNNWQKFVIANKSVLNDPRNPKYADAFAQSNYLFNDAQTYAARSIGKVKDLSQAYSVYEKNKDGVTENSILHLHNIGKPLDENPDKFDPTKIVAKPGLFDATKQKQFLDATFSGLKTDKKYGDAVIDKTAHQIINPFTESYSTDSKKIAVSKAASLYDNTPEAQAYFETEFANHDQDYETYNAAFKEYTGKDITSPRDAAVGWALFNAGKEKQGEERAAYNPYLGQHTTTINIAPPATVAADRFVDDAKSAVANRDPNKVSNIIQSFKTNANGKNISDWKMLDNGFIIYYTTDDKTATGKIRQREQEPIIVDFNDKDVIAKLIGLRQLFTGADNKLDLYNPEKIKVDQPKTSQKKVYKGLDKKGNPIFE